MNLAILKLKAEAVGELLILAEGETQYFEHVPLTLDEAGAKQIIAAFDKQGNDLPVDYEHSTIKRGSKGKSAPAVGFIRALRYEKGEGLIGTIEWTQEGKDQIESGAYRYFSPVLMFDDDGRVTRLHSMALTNKPRTKSQAERLAASMNLESEMTKKTKRMAAQEEAPPEGDGEGEGNEVLTKAAEQLRAWGVELSDEAAGSAESLLEVAMMTLAAFYETVEESADAPPPEEVAAEIVASLKLKSELWKTFGVRGYGGKTKVLIAKINELQSGVGTVPVAKYNTLAARVETLESDKAGHEANRLVASYVDKGKLLPDHEKQMKWARMAAAQDPDGFKVIMDPAPVVCEPGRQTAESDAPGSPVKRDRQHTIAASVRVFDAAPEDYQHAHQGRAQRIHVNGDLREAGMLLLTDEEHSKL